MATSTSSDLVPLKILRVLPPDPYGTSDGASGYSVLLELSRKVTEFERKAAPEIRPHLRVYGSTLELYRTTLEAVKNEAAQLSNTVTRIEAAGRKESELVEARLEAQRREDLARANETERLAKLAAEITFD
ncbi:hypothetical protein ACQR3V_11050 [Rhodococcus erythropolis]